jgi:(R,R)-butanediol dehydrogenase/meso-butanediol dehydrogenase/diacetyl reductase
MRAAVYRGRGDVRVEEVPYPGAPGPGELVLEVLRAGICGTDVHEYLHGPHLIPTGRPMVIGHEVLGRVAEAGSGAGFRPGERVVPGAGRWCGECLWCRSGRPNLCAHYLTYGLQADGGLAEALRVPAAMCHRVPDGCPDDAAVLAQPLAVAQHAVSRSRLAPGETVALFGVGGIGTWVLAAMVNRGLGPVIAVDVSAVRLDTARRLGAAETVEAGVGAESRLRELTGGAGADVAIECSGTEPGLRAANASVRRGGRLMLVGLQAEPRALDLHRLVIDEIEVLSSNAHICDTDLPAALSMLARFAHAQDVVDRVIPLERLVPDGIMAMAEGRATGKVVIDIKLERAG